MLRRIFMRRSTRKKPSHAGGPESEMPAVGEARAAPTRQAGSVDSSERRDPEADRLHRTGILAAIRAMHQPFVHLSTQIEVLRRNPATAVDRVEDLRQTLSNLEKGLQSLGVQFVGHPGGWEGFDPDLHQPLSSSVALEPGATVEVAFMGVEFDGKILQKALVRPAGEPESSLP